MKSLIFSIVIGGWASNSKYPFLGGIRSSAQMISYEIALGIARAARGGVTPLGEKFCEIQRQLTGTRLSITSVKSED
jgi:hypothetical protein